MNVRWMVTPCDKWTANVDPAASWTARWLLALGFASAVRQPPDVLQTGSSSQVASLDYTCSISRVNICIHVCSVVRSVSPLSPSVRLNMWWYPRNEVTVDPSYGQGYHWKLIEQQFLSVPICFFAHHSDLGLSLTSTRPMAWTRLTIIYLPRAQQQLS